MRPSQDFKVGQPVTFRGFKGYVVSINKDSAYPINVVLYGTGGFKYSFTRDGRYSSGIDVELFGLEENDKPVQEEVTADIAPSSRLSPFKTALAALLQEYNATFECDMYDDEPEMSVTFDGWASYRLCDGTYLSPSILL